MLELLFVLIHPKCGDQFNILHNVDAGWLEFVPPGLFCTGLHPAVCPGLLVTITMDSVALWLLVGCRHWEQAVGQGWAWDGEGKRMRVQSQQLLQAILPGSLLLDSGNCLIRNAFSRHFGPSFSEKLCYYLAQGTTLSLLFLHFLCKRVLSLNSVLIKLFWCVQDFTYFLLGTTHTMSTQKTYGFCQREFY